MKPRWNKININGTVFKINSLLKKQMDIMMKMVRNDFDAVFIVDGEIEGTGKSVLAQQVALYVDPTMCVERVVFTPGEFKDAVLNADKFQAVIWDEAYEGGNKFQIMSAVNQMIRSLLRQIRQKNLFIFIVIPAITDLDYDIAVRRSWGLLRAELNVDYETLEIQRGYFSFYSRKKKKWLYYVESNRLDMKKGYKCSNSFVGFFENVYGVNKQLYLEKKSDIRVNTFIDDRTFMEECIRRGIPWKSPFILAEILEYSEQHYYRVKRAILREKS
jgi:hypothetical protein